MKTPDVQGKSSGEIDKHSDLAHMERLCHHALSNGAENKARFQRQRFKPTESHKIKDLHWSTLFPPYISLFEHV